MKKLSKYGYLGYICIFSFCIQSCISAGTHGKIKGYVYPVPKDSLEAAVLKVIDNNSNIVRDTGKDYYNDTHRYISVEILDNGEHNSFTFHFGGDATDWKSLKKSDIAIVYAFNSDRNGGSQGRGDFPWYKSSLKNKLVAICERELIVRLDSVLDCKHQVEDE